MSNPACFSSCTLVNRSFPAKKESLRSTFIISLRGSIEIPLMLACFQHFILWKTLCFSFAVTNKQGYTFSRDPYTLESSKIAVMHLTFCRMVGIKVHVRAPTLLDPFLGKFMISLNVSHHDMLISLVNIPMCPFISRYVMNIC